MTNKTAKLPQKKKPGETKPRPNPKHLPKAKPKIEVKAAEVSPIKHHAKVEEQMVEKTEPALAKLGTRTKKKEVIEDFPIKPSEKMDKVKSILENAIKDSTKVLKSQDATEEKSSTQDEPYPKIDPVVEKKASTPPKVSGKDLSIDEVLPDG